MINTAIMRAQVLSGVALLDEKAPAGWENEIDLDTLDLARAHLCILGQLPGGYNASVEYLGLTHNFDVMVGHGFDTEGGLDAYPILTNLWSQVIRERRANA